MTTDIIKFHSKPNIPEKIAEMRIQYKSLGIPTILDDSLNLLLLTVNLKKPKHILEIGTATGMSGISMLYNCDNAFLTTIEKDETSYCTAKNNFEEFGYSNAVKQYLGDAGDILNYLEGSFDFIFLDGAKARYLDYLDDILRLLAPSGVLFADNVLFRGYVDGSVKFGHRDNTIVRNMREFINKMVSFDNFITQIHEIGDGVLISTKLK